jgi:hypothetical protein
MTMALLTITTGGLRPLPLSLLSQSLPMLSRHELEDVVERLIDELDRRDGDPDLEPEEDRCVAGDDGCGPVEQHGRVFWGSECDEHGVGTPRYGLDQSLGPMKDPDLLITSIRQARLNDQRTAVRPLAQEN